MLYKHQTTYNVKQNNLLNNNMYSETTYLVKQHIDS